MTDPRHQHNDKRRPDGLDPHRFYGRRKGPKLSHHQSNLMETLLPQIHVDLASEELGSIDPASLFDHGPEQVWFEIGFGSGEHLAALAKAYPKYGFIGCEPYLNGVASLVAQIAEENLTNIRIYTDDARRILRALKPGTLDRVFLLHPDPWPKTRHAKRRFIGPKNLDLISSALKQGGEFRVGTDHPLYAQWTALQMARRGDYRWIIEQASDWRSKPDDWPDTRYESKAIEGEPVYLRYQRV